VSLKFFYPLIRVKSPSSSDSASPLPPPHLLTSRAISLFHPFSASLLTFTRIAAAFFVATRSYLLEGTLIAVEAPDLRALSFEFKPSGYFNFRARNRRPDFFPIRMLWCLRELQGINFLNSTPPPRFSARGETPVLPRFRTHSLFSFSHYPPDHN